MVVREVLSALSPRVELDNALELVNPDSAKSFGSVRMLQTHARTLPGDAGKHSTTDYLD
jgi:hypothetical protein